MLNLTLIYTSKLLFKQYGNHFIVYMLIMYKLIKRLSFQKVKTAPQEYFQCHMQNLPFTDYNNLCIIPQNIYNILKLLNYEKQYVQLKISNKELRSKKYKIRIANCISAPDLENETIIITEEMHCNLHLNENLDNYMIHIFGLGKSFPKIAKTVTVAFINNQFDINQSLLEVLLQNYFKSPKLLCANDIFQVSAQKTVPDLIYTNSSIRNKNYYFKCLSILNEENQNMVQGFCIKGETALSQKAHILSFIPSSTNMLCESSNKLISNCPYGFKNSFSMLEECILPFIKTEKQPTHIKPMFLLKGEIEQGQIVILNAVAKHCGFHLKKIECSDIVSITTAHTETKLRNIFSKTKFCTPCVLLLNNFQVLFKDTGDHDDSRLILFFQNEIKHLLENNNLPILLVCVSYMNTLSSQIERLFLEVINFECPTELERLQLLEWLLEYKNIQTKSLDINLETIAQRSHSFVFGDIEYLVSQAQKIYHFKNEINTRDFIEILDKMQGAYSDSIGAPKIPKVYWEDIGGLQNIKDEIIKTINYPIKYQHLMKNTTLKRSGLLLYGPPGTGKTLIAKAVATECGLNFLSIKGPELLNMYVGQSELNVRQVFKRARQAAPCIIFFDELDSLAPNRGVSGDSGGVMDRIVSQLLSEMDGLNEVARVFIIGATNRPDLIDPALLRPGRFDKLLYVGLCSTFESKYQILSALTRKFKSLPDLKEVVEILPENVTGADLQAVCSNAWLYSVRRTILSIEKEFFKPKDILITLEDFKKSVEDLKPSVGPETLKYYEKVQQQFGIKQNVH